MIVPSLVLLFSYALLVALYIGSTSALELGALGRRAFIATSSAPLLATVAAPAFAAGYGEEYIPNVEDVKVIATLGITLDKLAIKVGDPLQWGDASSNLAQFAKDPNFYPGYAKNFVLKTIKNNAEADPRVGKINLAVKTVISVKDVIGEARTSCACYSKVVF